MRDILLEIAARSAQDLKAKKAALPEAGLIKAIEKRERQPLSLYAALKREGVSVIAEIKKASPSKGVIRGSLDVPAQARLYGGNGAAAVSVLTEENFFLGSLADLRAARAVLEIPVLRKDFIFDPYQVLEAAAAGADALLLIAALVRDDKVFKELLALTESFGMEALCEAHSLEEGLRLADLGASIVGVNCRDLRTFQVYPERAEEVLSKLPSRLVKVAESGIAEPADLRKYPSADGFLIGEALVRAADPGEKLRQFRGAGE